jgi:hypothetical protein
VLDAKKNRSTFYNETDRKHWESCKWNNSSASGSLTIVMKMTPMFLAMLLLPSKSSVALLRRKQLLGCQRLSIKHSRIIKRNYSYTAVLLRSYLETMYPVNYELHKLLINEGLWSSRHSSSSSDNPTQSFLVSSQTLLNPTNAYIRCYYYKGLDFLT